MSPSAKRRSQCAKLELQILKKVCREIDSPRSLMVYLLAESGQLLDLLTLDIRPDDYVDPSAFADDYLVTELLKKSVAQFTDIDREKAAFDKWLSAEEQCAQANERLECFLDGLVTPTNRLTGRVVARAIQICHEALGPLSKSTLHTVFNNMEFGPGSTASVSGRITRGRKFSNPYPTTSQRLLSFGLFYLPHLWRNLIKEFRIVDYNKLSFVPKNAKIDRAITVETDLNIYVQKGIGSVLRLKLRNLGIDLDHQQQVNRTLVSRSFRDDLCTIDLASASDTVSFSLVRVFLPDDWFDLLCWARPEYSAYDKQLYKLEKFSGMGNGFTFELETLIYYCLLQASKEETKSVAPITVFGDDMICGCDAMHCVVDCLNFLGLKVNSEKSYGKSAFHESCGCDYFQDLSVRPIYLRYDNFDHEEVFYLYQYCNLLRRYASHRLGGVACDGRFLPAWLECFTRIPKRLRLFVPSWDYNNAGVVGNFDEAVPSIRIDRSAGFSGFWFRGLAREAVKTQRYLFGAYIASLSQTSSFTGGREAVRGLTRSGRIKEFYSLNWIELGPWV